jgi:hypothetical protein
MASVLKPIFNNTEETYEVKGTTGTGSSRTNLKCRVHSTIYNNTSSVESQEAEFN